MVEVHLPEFNVRLWGDMSTGKFRPYVPVGMRRDVFNSLHMLSHPSIRRTRQLVSQRYVWPAVNRDCPDRRFDHVHLDLVRQLPASRGFSYLLSMIDRFTSWPEIAPISNASTTEVARAFLIMRIDRFGIQTVITTDQAGQFQSSLAPTSAYHLQANWMVERLHRQLKGALAAHALVSPSWIHAVTLVLLGLRCMAFSSATRMLSILWNSATSSDRSSARYAPQTRKPSRSAHAWFVPNALDARIDVFLRNDANRPPLSPTYGGPYLVTARTSKTVTILCRDRLRTVSIDRVKPTFGDPDHNVTGSRVTFDVAVELVP
ncbi:hypothetical protein M514_12303 [Trichuris suis]|uniref:Integrase catalytic domain-containing protein n=1 Tax=Trichuris suis TaxID=68888 RepID=A0A085MX98_9BILA|nr:hypothetical protein M514_12303 [Trichuris suis]